MNNVILIMTDQHRADAMGCYGNRVVETPNLDWLASQGTRFTHAYSPSPSCVPARASLLTGLDPWHTGILGMGRGQGPMGVGFDYTLPGALADAGYQTFGVGKMHFYPQRARNGFHETVLDESGRKEDPDFVSDYRSWFLQQRSGPYDIDDHGIGWNSWMARPYHAPEALHPTTWTVNEAISFVERRDPTKPFFLKVSFARPHSPYDPPSYYFDLYRDKEIPEPYRGNWDQLHNDPREALKPDAWRGVQSPEAIRRARQGYYGSITFIDHQLGRLISFLQKKGLFDPTLFVFLSDHGDMLGDHHLWRKTYAYEGSARIPLIVKPPVNWQEPVCKEVSHPVIIQDVMPTILDFLDMEVKRELDGISMKGLIRGEKAHDRTYIHGEHSTCYSEEQEMQFLTDGKIKYIWFPRLGAEQLFDLQADLSESIDLAPLPEWHDVLAVWRQRMVQRLASRDLGLTEGDQLVSQAGKPFIVSPYYKKRLEASSYDWLS